MADGRMTWEATVWCGHPDSLGGCMRWEALDMHKVGHSKAKANVDARTQGWVKSRAFGWLCPDHGGLP